MTYLLNAVYALILVIASPWVVFQAIFRGKYREGFAAKFWGDVPERKTNGPCIWFHAVSVGEVNLLSVLLKEGGTAAARRGVCDLHDHDDGLFTGQAKVSAKHSVLLPIGFLLGSATGHAADSAVTIGAGGIGTVAESCARGAGIWSAGGDRKWPLERTEFSRIPADWTIIAAGARQDRPGFGAERRIRGAISITRRVGKSSKSDRLAEIRRRDC